MNRPRVLIVDDHQVVVEGLVRLLRDHADIVSTLNDGQLVVDAAARLAPDVVVLDISLPGMSGLEVVHHLKKAGFQGRTIILTMHADAALAVEALSAGASGFVLKESSGEELVTALQVVSRGGTYLPMGLTKEIVTLMVDAPDAARVELTPQQREILRLIVRGHRAKEIAGTLEMSTRTVEAIKYKTMQQLDVHSTAELVRYVVEHRLVSF
jgi:DNA-binding NarL/FixJ family response regulator